MSRRTQFGVACTLVGILIGMFIISHFPGLITYLVMIFAIGFLAIMLEMRYHLVQPLLRRRSTTRSSVSNQPPPRAPQAQQPTQYPYRRRSIP